jgi:hypothetical protein
MAISKNKKKENNHALGIVKRELKRASTEKKIISIFLLATVLSVSVLFLFLLSNFYITGNYVIESQAGYITEVTLYDKFSVTYWNAIYGLALRVQDFTEILFGDFSNGEIVRQDLFFDCIQSDVIGGPEIYAANHSYVDFDNLVPATAEMVDLFTGCSGRTECAQNTFVNTMDLMIGLRNVTGIPSTYTYKYDGDNQVFQMGVLTDGSSLVFVAPLEPVQRSYDYDKIVNFQLLLPNSANGTQTYYFFTDPNDVCPEGGVGENIEANISGYVFDEGGNPIFNATVLIAGNEFQSGVDGYYYGNFTALAGGYNLVVQKEGYDDFFKEINVSFTNYNLEENITLNIETPGIDEIIIGTVYGNVEDEFGNSLENVKVIFGEEVNYTNSSGDYTITSLLTPGNHSIVGSKTNYNTYYDVLEFLEDSEISHDMVLETSAIDYEFITGPYTDEPNPGEYDIIPEEVLATGEDYWISTKEINKEVRQNTFIEDRVGLYNLRKTVLSVTFSVSPSLEGIVNLDKATMSLDPGENDDLIVTIFGNRPIGIYEGSISMTGDLDMIIPVTVRIVERKFPVEVLLMEIDLFKNIVRPGDNLKYKLKLQNLLRDQDYQVELVANLKRVETDEIYYTETFNSEVAHSITLLEEISIPENASSGDYLLEIEAKYLNLFSTAAAAFIISKPVYLYTFFGIPLWIIFSIVSFISFAFLNFFLYKRYTEKKKRYQIKVDYNTLPEPGDRTVRLGYIAETRHPSYYEIDRLTTHAIVAGATGMGKSISAQVVIEEALLQDIAVIVFDPTAQWSGMLRKCEDKKMLAYYSKFGMKLTDARAFKGNVRQVQNARQIIDVTKYMNPGQIQIFSLNKLQPNEMDIFVANVIRQVFKSDPKENPNLKLLIVFDEVHRLLPKFGGSGEGFLQIERACREFRKWGLGVMLISQVLNDFVGEIKANINTELQTRTLEENDLERIRTKYGEEFLKSLVRAEVGVIMFQNAEYNRGRPYFVNFRPILHSTRRLPDEELEKYNKYNDLVDDLEDSVLQLEKEKVDTFDLKMELKLIKDKIMSGSFSVVEIYLEGLSPRVDKEWEKLGKKPKKRVIQVASEEEIQKSIQEAKEQREKAEAAEKKAGGNKLTEKPKEAESEKKEIS